MPEGTEFSSPKETPTVAKAARLICQCCRRTVLVAHGEVMLERATSCFCEDCWGHLSIQGPVDCEHKEQHEETPDE